MFLIFQEASIEENLARFNRWNQAAQQISANPNIFSLEFKQYFISLPYKFGFGAQETWIWDAETQGFSVTQQIIDPGRKTLRWAEPRKHLTEPWIAFPLIPEWDAIPSNLKNEALEQLGRGVEVEDLAGW